MKLVPKNWVDFQHYKDRAPPWIKLHKGLLDDSVFQRLPVASRALAPMLWLLASEAKDGAFDASLSELSFRLRQTEKEIDAALKPLISNGFFVVVQSDSDTLAECKQDAMPEERQRESKRQTREEEIPPYGVTSQTWQDWLALRKAKRAAVTKTVIDGAVSEAAKAGMPLEDFLKIWCRRGSQGLEASWLKPDEKGQQTETAYQRSMRERVDQAIGRNRVYDPDPQFLEIEQ